MSSPDDVRADRMLATKDLLDSGVPPSSRNKGPIACGLIARYDRTAETGHSMLSVFPRKMVTPLPTESVLLLCNVTEMHDGLKRLSNRISAGLSISLW